MQRDYFLQTDAHGQPRSNLNAKARADRVIDELLGISKGIIADGIVTEAEACFLKQWIEQNPEAVLQFPGKHLAERLARIFADGKVTPDEQRELYELLSQLTGNTGAIVTVESKSTRLIFDEPEPTIEFPAKAFSFTGKFVSGTRNWCAEQVVNRGGVFHEKPLRETTFLIVGTGGSRDWVHSTFGRKIEKALEFRQKYGTKIVAEEHWARAL